MMRNCIAYQENGFCRGLLVMLVLFLCFGVCRLASGEEGEKAQSA